MCNWGSRGQGGVRGSLFGRWALGADSHSTEQGWRRTGKGRWEGTHMMTCQLLSPVSVCFFVLRGPPPSPCQGLPQSPTGIMHHLVMKGLSNGSFLYPSLTKLEWQLFPLPIPDFILSLSGSEYILSEWISLEALVCVCSHVFSFLFFSLHSYICLYWLHMNWVTYLVATKVSMDYLWPQKNTVWR